MTRAEEKSHLANQFAKALVTEFSQLAEPEQMSLGEIA